MIPGIKGVMFEHVFAVGHLPEDILRRPPARQSEWQSVPREQQHLQPHHPGWVILRFFWGLLLYSHLSSEPEGVVYPASWQIPLLLGTRVLSARLA